MRNWTTKLLPFFSILLLGSSAMAKGVELVDAMRSEGKIYVVVAVLVIIFLVLMFYLFSIDKKVSKLEELLKK
jgi:hypothetical protein